MKKIITSLFEKAKKSNLVLVYWKLAGRKLPPPHVYKQSVIKKLAKEFDIEILIETGTYKGDMIEALKKRFKKLTSIELSEFYFKNATKKFSKDGHIKIIHGDSGKEIKKLLKTLKKPALFWLDGHFSGGKTAKTKVNTPVMEELKAIFNHSLDSHVVLVDDARLFNGKEDYPKVNEIRKLLKGIGYQLVVKDDIIRITPLKS